MFIIIIIIIVYFVIDSVRKLLDTPSYDEPRRIIIMITVLKV
jgi:hypothetical protein